VNSIMNFLIKPWKILSQPDQALQELRDESFKDTFAYLALWSAWLGLLTAFTNMVGIPCNLLHSGTNPQLFAYHDIAPELEQVTGVPLWIWMTPLVWLLTMLFVPVASLFYHLVFKLFRGKGSYWHTVRFFVYPATPVLLFGWLPYLGGTVIAFWTAAYYPLALRRMHRFSWGFALLFVGVLMGVQIGRIFLTGEWYGIPMR
jgi:hypothetical protein